MSGAVGRPQRGALRLALAGAILLLALQAGLDGLSSWSLLHAGPVRAAGIGWLIGMPVLLLAACGWALVVWRQADAGWTERGTVVALLLWLLASTTLAAVPFAGTAWAMAQASSPGLQMERADGGRTLPLSGSLGPADIAPFRQQLQQAGLVRVDVVRLPAGSAALGPAIALAGSVRQQGLDTRLQGPCEGPCALLFLAGQRRHALPESQLALQGLAAPSLNPLWRRWLQQQQLAIYSAAGLPAPLLNKLPLMTAPALWRPDRHELASAGVLTAPGYALDVDLPPAAGASVDEYQQALRSHGTWQALERRFPGSLALAAQQMAAARLQPGSEGDSAAHAAAQQVAMAALHQLLQGGSGEARLLYLALLDEQLSALSQAADCRALLAGDLQVRRQLGAALARREAGWIEDASQETPNEAARRRTQPLELEVLRRAMGERDSALLPALWTVGRGGTSMLSCEGARELLRRVLQLAGPERRLAARRIFVG